MTKLVDQGNESRAGVPTPTTRFRRRAWREFQRALDPFASPRPLPMRRLRELDG